jgi:hypothetical protein
VDIRTKGLDVLLKAANGAIYDIDFFIIVRSGTLSVTEATVHKINGKPL